jgi:hypothetical protein
VSDETIFILRENGRPVGYVRCREIAQWWAEQKLNRGWWKLEPKYFSYEEAGKIVDAIVVKKEKS